MGVNRSSRALWSLGFSGQLPWISFPYPKTQLIPALILRLFYRFTKLSRLSFIRCLSHLLDIHYLSEMSLLMESDLFFSHSFKSLTQGWGYVAELHSFPPRNAPKSDLATFLQDFHLYPRSFFLVTQIWVQSVITVCFSHLPAQSSQSPPSSFRPAKSF